jgi:hypothetical protein
MDLRLDAPCIVRFGPKLADLIWARSDSSGVVANEPCAFRHSPSSSAYGQPRSSNAGRRADDAGDLHESLAFAEHSTCLRAMELDWSLTFRT